MKVQITHQVVLHWCARQYDPSPRVDPPHCLTNLARQALNHVPLVQNAQVEVRAANQRNHIGILSHLVGRNDDIVLQDVLEHCILLRFAFLGVAGVETEVL